MSVKPLDNAASKDWASSLRLQWKGEARRLRGFITEVQTLGDLNARDRASVDRLGKDLWKRVPGGVLEFLAQTESKEQAAKATSEALHRTPGCNPLKWIKDYYDRLLTFYLGIGRAIAYHSDLYAPVDEIPPGWLKRHTGVNRCCQQALPCVTFHGSAQDTVRTKAVRIHTIGSALDREECSGYFGEIAALLKYVCGEPFTDEDSPPPEGLKGWKKEWASTGSHESPLGTLLRKARNVTSHEFAPEILKVKSLQAATEVAHLMIRAALLPFCYFDLCYRPTANTAFCLVYNSLGEHGAGVSESDVQQGSALDASGWTGFFLWARLPERSNDRPGKVHASQVFRLLPLFPAVLSSDQYEFSQGQMESESSLEVRLEVVTRMEAPDRKLELRIARRSPPREDSDACIISPVTNDAHTARSLVWIDAKAPGEPGAFRKSLASLTDGRGLLEVVPDSYQGGSPAEISILHLPAGPSLVQPAPGRDHRAYFARVQCNLVPRKIDRRKSESKPWIVPQLSLPIRFNDDLLDALVGTNEDPAWTRTALGFTSHYLYVVVLPDSRENLWAEDAGRREELYGKLTKFLESPIRESPWLPDVWGRGTLRLFLTGSHSESLPELLPVLMERPGSSAELLPWLEKLTRALKDRRTGQITTLLEDDESYLLDQPEIHIPWLLWALLSASQGLDILEPKQSQQVDGRIPRLGSNPVDPMHLRINQPSSENGFLGWPRLFDLQQALMGVETFDEKCESRRWRSRSGDALAAPGRETFSRFAHDLIYFVGEGSLPSQKSSTWKELGLEDFDGWGGDATATTFVAAAASKISQSLATAANEYVMRVDRLREDGAPRSLDPKIDETRVQFELALVDAMEALHRTGDTPSASTTPALQSAMDAALQLTQVCYVASCKALREYARRGQASEYAATRSYLVQLTKLGPFWSHSNEASSVEPGPEATEVAEIKRQIDTNLLTGLESLAKRFESGFSADRTTCKWAADQISCPRSFAVTCPCTHPFRNLIFSVPAQLKIARAPARRDDDQLVMDSLSKLVRLLLSSSGRVAPRIK